MTMKEQLDNLLKQARNMGSLLRKMNELEEVHQKNVEKERGEHACHRASNFWALKAAREEYNKEVESLGKQRDQFLKDFA